MITKVLIRTAHRGVEDRKSRVRMGRDIELINKSRQRDEENKIAENTNTYLHLSLEAYHTMRIEKPDKDI